MTSNSLWARLFVLLSIVRIATCGRGYRESDPNAKPCQDPRSLAGSETGREQAVVDLARDGEAVERSRRQVQPKVVGKAVGGGIRVAFGRRNDPVMVGIHARDLRGVRIVQPPLEILHTRLERGWPQVDVHVDF